ncbi:prolyl oligopeptidase family serine peptidase [Stieleria tagensis]|uniref:prolyl oligopeptidase family serine peptidase n=1 Tax=Stieleria tagensis TaxID=2956795 RepID=UPI00209B4D74|nr:prolyl oligopeptidase family serine peptidase [Stieleria tagensis]
MAVIGCVWQVLVLFGIGLTPVVAAPPAGGQPLSDQTINQRIVPEWIDDTQFTFQQRSPDGNTRTLKVDAVAGTITPLETGSDQIESGLRGGAPPQSQSSGTETSVTFENVSDQTVQLFWIDTNGRPQGYGKLEPGETHSQHTYSGHTWMVRGGDENYFGSLVAQSPPTEVQIKTEFELPQSLSRRPRRRRGSDVPRSSTNKSADGEFEFRRQDTGLQLRRSDTADESWQDLDVGSMDGHEIVSPEWSPDGTVLAAWKVKRHKPADALTLESSPPGGGRAVLQRHSYRLPGDPYDEFELLVYDAASGERIQTDVPTIDFGRPRLRWLGDQQIVLEKIDRGHQRLRLLVVDPANSTTRTLIDETTDTFIWTMHGPQIPLLSYLEKSDQVIYASECSGYRHLYLVDLNGPGLQSISDPAGHQKFIAGQAITAGDWLVREIVAIHEDQGYMDLMVGEFYDDQDPYHRHLVRAQIDGSDFVAITAADGDHRATFSPDGRFAITTHSRVDLPPVHQLRRTSDGQLITELMAAERLQDGDTPWTLPRVFHARGRDGQTEIWGNVYFPDNFDPAAAQRYPLIEAIYAGPHDSHVPKRYSHSKRFSELTALGFVVVQIDGMGTANRSKAFHDVCWQNLKDAGFPDRIAWMKAVGDQYPALDLSRVGIFGTSAGGQNACGAVLFHGDFYNAAYASCGCHDNRMDKASWNEQWMGYPVGPHYAQNSNIDNAGKLSGELFLVVGELDQNVPPESTFRLVDALIKADKDFRYLMVPGMGHSDGGSYGRRQMRDFFVEQLRPAAR